MNPKIKKIMVREGLIFLGFVAFGILLRYITIMFCVQPSPTIHQAVQVPFASGLFYIFKDLLPKLYRLYSDYAYISYVIIRLIVWDTRTSKINRETKALGANSDTKIEKKMSAKIKTVGVIAFIYGAYLTLSKYFAFYKVISKGFVWQIDIRLITDLAFPVIIIVSAIGMLFLKNWARVALLAVSICHLAINGSNLFLLSFFGITLLPKYITDYRNIFQLLFEGILPLVLPITFLCILFNPKVKEQFKR